MTEFGHLSKYEHSLGSIAEVLDFINSFMFDAEDVLYDRYPRPTKFKNLKISLDWNE